MSKMINIAVDAMGGDNSPQKIIDGIITGAMQMGIVSFDSRLPFALSGFKIN